MIPLALLQIAGKAAPYAIAGALAITAYQLAPILGVNAQRHHLEHQRDTYRDSAVAWHGKADGYLASFRKSEGFRKDEHAEAVRSIEEEHASCNLRVAEARKSALAIRKIVEKPAKLDAGGCPVREVVSADDLKAALGVR